MILGNVAAQNEPAAAKMVPRASHTVEKVKLLENSGRAVWRGQGTRDNVERNASIGMSPLSYIARRSDQILGTRSGAAEEVSEGFKERLSVAGLAGLQLWPVRAHRKGGNGYSPSC